MKLLALSGLMLVSSALAQQPADSFSFQLERPGAPVPTYTLTVSGDGSATYQVSYPPEPSKYSPYAASLSKVPNTEVTIKTNLSESGTARIFEKLQATNGFSSGCASKAKNIADTGTKTLTYTVSGAKASCVYNYTEDKNIVALTTMLQAIAYTLDEGRKLEREHRYDRLALDPETDYLVKAAKEGNAAEFGAIGPTLRAIAEDPQVLERVRKRATTLLELAAQNP